jgi:putative transposase
MRHRARWQSRQKRVDASRLVFIDETWTKTNMTRLYGWAPRGERLIDKVPQGKWKTATFLAALRNDRIEAPCLFDGPINGERFRAYVEQFLVPTLKPNDIVILDNLGSHKGKGGAQGDPECRSPPRVPAEILPRPQPH